MTDVLVSTAEGIEVLVYNYTLAFLQPHDHLNTRNEMSTLICSVNYANSSAGPIAPVLCRVAQRRPTSLSYRHHPGFVH